MPRRDGTMTEQELLRVQSPDAPARPVLTVDGAGPVPLYATFHMDRSQGAIAAWTLDFGDGSPVRQGIAAPPASLTHTYATPGTYTAVLTVTDPRARRVTAEVQVTAAAPEGGVPAGALGLLVAMGGDEDDSGAVRAAATTAIVSAFDRFLVGRRADQEQTILTTLDRDEPDLTPVQRDTVVDEEILRERLFAAKARERLDRDLRQAFTITDPEQRRKRIDVILERERRYVELREEAIETRARGRADAERVRAASPEGAFWLMSPRLEHCDRCAAMANRAWPWSVLDRFLPPVHLNCGCRLLTLRAAYSKGLLASEDTVATYDDFLRILPLLESPEDLDHDDIADDLSLLEAAYDERWGKGTAKAGQFKPKRGGDPGARLLRRGRGRRIRPLDIDPVPARRDAVPVKGIGDEADVRELNVADLKAGDRVMVNGALDEVKEVRQPGLVELEGMGLVHIGRDTIRGIPADPDPTPDPTPPEPTAAPPQPKTGPTYADLESSLLTRKMGDLPDEAGPLDVPGFAYLGKGEKVSYKREVRDGVLYLPDGFFRQGKDRREEIVFKHFGVKLADALGDSGLANLADQDSHLRSRKAVIDTYYALNSPARDRMVDLHPDAARLVAGAAHEQGLPLHPDAAKLVGASATVDVAPEQHPALKLSEQVNGMEHTPAYSLLLEAGYNSGPVAEDGWVVWRSHDHGAAIHLNPYSDTLQARVAIDTADQSAAEGLTGLSFTDARERLQGKGFTLETNTADTWYEMVHPDGRAVAFAAGSDGNVGRARAFTPEAEELRDAQRIGWGRDPLGSNLVGEDGQAVREAMRRSGWSILRTNAADRAGDVFTLSRVTADGRDEVRMEDRDGKVVAIGRPGAEPGSIVTDEEYQRARAEARERREAEDRARQEQADEAKRQEASKYDDIVAALAAGKKPKLEGMPMHATVLHFRDELGWQVVTARRRGYRQGGGVVYTLRSTNGDTLTFNGSHTIEKVTKFAPAPKIDRKRVTGRPPKDVKEFSGDALGRVDELADRFGGVGAISTILYGTKPDHAAVREWNGTMVMGREVKPSIDRYLKKRAAGEATTDEERLDFYSALQTVQHEINHGVTAPGASRTQGSLTPRDYQGPGKGWEEALTEESAHLLVVDWLRSYDMPEVLAAVKRHPGDQRVRGVYRQYRDSLRTILDDAGVPQEERAQLIEDMKFRMTPEERLGVIGEKLQARGHVRRNMRTGDQMNPRDEAYYRMTTSERGWTSRTRGPDWEPVVRPDLSGVDTGPDIREGATLRLSSGQDVQVVAVSPTEVVVETPNGRVRSMKADDFYDPVRHGPMSEPIAGGRRVIAGYRVWVDPDGIEGRVVEVMADGRTVKVETEDGMALWYSIDRLR